jgi:hypothetical protein
LHERVGAEFMGFPALFGIVGVGEILWRGNVGIADRWLTGSNDEGYKREHYSTKHGEHSEDDCKICGFVNTEEAETGKKSQRTHLLQKIGCKQGFLLLVADGALKGVMQKTILQVRFSQAWRGVKKS